MNRKPIVSVCAAVVVGAFPTFLAAQTTATDTGGTAAPPPPAASGTPTAAVPEDEEIVTLSPFEVSAERDTGYQATETLAGTRIRTELRDVGAAIQVVTKEMLTDLGATGNATLLQYTTNTEVGGVYSTYAGLGNGTSVDESGTLRAPGGANRVRGLSAADNTRDFFVSDIPWDSYNVDRIDIQRGPNSILFGLGKPAGIVNASLRNPQFRNSGEVGIRVGSYGSIRTNVDANLVLIPNTLAIRVGGLWDDEKFRQDPAYEDDQRAYGAIRFDPDWFKERGFRTSIRAKYENGEIEANRPRTVTPNDHISPFFRPTAVSDSNPFGGMNKLTYGNTWGLSNGYNAEREDTPPVAGDGRGYTRAADPDYSAWVSGRGNQQQPFYFVDGATSQLYSLYGGFINKGVRSSTGAQLSASTAIPGQRFSGVFYGVQGLPQYANSARLPGYQYGQYREQSLTDPTIFNFYDTLIDGPNKAEWENWDAYNIALSETAFNDRVGVELIYDRQKYDRGGRSGLGFAPTLDIDYLRAFQDLSTNVNAGRPYVQANGNGSSYESDREAMRVSLFAEFRAQDVMDEGLLRKIIGRHRINGVYASEDYASADNSWNLYATSKSFDDYTGVPLPFNDRPPIAMVYLGPSIASRTAAGGANIPGVKKKIQLNDGNMYHFSSQWNGVGVNFGDTWTVPASHHDVFNGINAPGSTTQLYQNSNWANYVGWNSNHYLDILRYEDGDQSTMTNASKALRSVESFAGTWQSYWWDGALVGTLGWRTDTVKGKDVRAASTGPRSTLVLDPAVFKLPDDYLSEFSEDSFSWGAVLHMNKILDRDFLPINVSLSYNTSSNFEVSSTRRNLYGDVIGNPTGETEDYGILLATKDGKYSFRAVKYEATVTDSSTPMSNLNGVFGNIIVDGLRWRNVFLYNLNAYTLDTANGSNEWRYNFDPDTTIGETQEQATARENAAINAWNQIQAWLPERYFAAWGFPPGPTDNLTNPTPATVYAYNANRPPAGLTMTSDTMSKGYEFELTANPLTNWRIAFNASQTEATRSNVGSPETIEYIEFMTEMMAGPAGELRQFSGGPTANTMRTNWNNAIGSYTLMKLQEGASSSEIREWRFNVLTNYTFQTGALKDFAVGGSYRWEDKVVIGYPVVAVSSSEYSFDLDHPYYGPVEDFVDLWFSYQRKITEKVQWRIQLNIRNVFGTDGLIPMSVQPDGETWASVRVKPNREWLLTNTFSF